MGEVVTDSVGECVSDCVKLRVVEGVGERLRDVVLESEGVIDREWVEVTVDVPLLVSESVADVEGVSVKVAVGVRENEGVLE